MNEISSSQAAPEKQSLNRVNAAQEWRSKSSGATASILSMELATGLLILLLPFGLFVQFSLLLHVLIGLLTIIPVSWFIFRHWKARYKGNLNHYQLLGYFALFFLFLNIVSGVVETIQGLASTRISPSWDLLHLSTGLATGLFVLIHIVTLFRRKATTKTEKARRGTAKKSAAEILVSAKRVYLYYCLFGLLILIPVAGFWTLAYQADPQSKEFAADYSLKYAKDRPFAPSLAQLDNTEWKEQQKSAVLKLLSKQHHAGLLSFLNKPNPYKKGLVEQVRAGLDKLQVAQQEKDSINLILDSAQAKLLTTGAIPPQLLTGSESCGSSNCHSQIVKEWLPSAHRYSSMDVLFQRVQEIMVEETAPEVTRYCAGCHDPISLFAGAKTQSNITLSADGANEGVSCLVCHSIVQADVQGNGDYTVRPAVRYAFELKEGNAAKFISDFLIRIYPKHHISSYSRSLYKTPEFCGSCHKQYVDKEVNIDIGKVQGQNQYDSWKNSHWNQDREPQETINCRECHMPLVASVDPARGDATDYNRQLNDNKHRSHRTLASNQYIPKLMGLEGADEHTHLTEKWLRGEIEIPEIAEKWTTGPTIQIDIHAPSTLPAGITGIKSNIRVILSNRKTGHDYPTGPLDMIESWLELQIEDNNGQTIYHSGQLDESGNIVNTQLSYRADGFDRKGKLIDRHNLWDLVGASYKRSLYPGMSDTVNIQLETPPEGAEKLSITAKLWYRKVNNEFLIRVYGENANTPSPATLVSEATASIKLIESKNKE